MAKKTTDLAAYRAKRTAGSTPEPFGRTESQSAVESSALPARHVYVMQKHNATRLHYDLRLEVDGVLKSWAVPKGPSMDPGHKRLAVPVEDHSLGYGDFEGNVGMGGGSGAVIQWDRGTYEPRGDAEELDLDSGHVSFVLYGEKLQGAFALTKTGPKSWILVKMRDEHARRGSDIAAERPESVVSGRTWQEVAQD